MFEIGDRVVCNNKYEFSFLHGEKGTVVDPNYYNFVMVKFDNQPIYKFLDPKPMRSYHLDKI